MLKTRFSPARKLGSWRNRSVENLLCLLSQSPRAQVIQQFLPCLRRECSSVDHLGVDREFRPIVLFSHADCTSRTDKPRSSPNRFVAVTATVCKLVNQIHERLWLVSVHVHRFYESRLAARLSLRFCDGGFRF